MLLQLRMLALLLLLLLQLRMLALLLLTNCFCPALLAVLARLGLVLARTRLIVADAGRIVQGDILAKVS